MTSVTGNVRKRKTHKQSKWVKGCQGLGAGEQGLTVNLPLAGGGAGRATKLGWNQSREGCTLMNRELSVPEGQNLRRMNGLSTKLGEEGTRRAVWEEECLACLTWAGLGKAELLLSSRLGPDTQPAGEPWTKPTAPRAMALLLPQSLCTGFP